MFSPLETKTLFRSLTPPIAILELTNATGIITEARASADLLSLLQGSGRTTVYELSQQLFIDAHTIARLLPADAARIGSSTVLRYGEVERLRTVMKEELEKGVVSTTEFGRREEIDLGLIRRVLPEETGWLGDVSVYSLEFYEKAKKTLEQLRERDTPMSGVELVPRATMALVRKAVGELVKEGIVKGFWEAERWIPEAYVDGLQKAAIEELKTDGVVGIEKVKEAYIKDPMAFVKEHLPDAQLLATSFVTAEFLEKLENGVEEQVKKEGWSYVKDLEHRLTPEDEKVFKARIITKLEVFESAGVVVSKAASTALEEKCKTFSQQKADMAWKRRAKQQPVDPPIKKAEITQLLAADSKLPESVLTQLTNRLHSIATKTFKDRYEQLRQVVLTNAKKEFTDKFYARFAVHLRALASIKDITLRDRLAGDLLQWAKTTGTAAVEKLDMVLMTEDLEGDHQPLYELRLVLQTTGQGRPETCLRDVESSLQAFMPLDDLTKYKEIMMNEINLLLQSTSDYSLALLSTLLLLLATRSGGVLKASGKYVPKLFKEVQGAGLISSEQLVLLTNVKSAVAKGIKTTDQGQSDVSADEMAQLKAIGAQASPKP
ncbi:hypothetical protein BZA77DRAFT_150088 [Pyronema omphalodes]|nr:hypothetical protein BZA77DRAFT_150088 [Pyronema omphalodes]